MTSSTRSNHEPLTYSEAGVDVDRGNALVNAIKPAVRSTARPGANAEIGGFGGVFDLAAAGFRDPLLVAANDGVGTKVKIAIETGIHRTVGIDLVAMCVNDLVVQGAEPLFFLDYYAAGRLEPAIGAEIIEGIAEGCRNAGCALIGGESAEMPGLYAPGDYDLAGFAVGAVERDVLLPRNDLAAGDVLIGLAASGVHSNGFSLVRRLVADRGLGWERIAPYDGERTLGEALLEPTRIYVRSALSVIRQTGAIKALSHITGGGLTENLPRVLPETLAAEIDLGAIPPLPVFGWIKQEADLEQAEMLRTFNCGVGMVAIVPAGAADSVLSAFRQAGETAFVVGRLAERVDTEHVRYSGSVGQP